MGVHLDTSYRRLGTATHQIGWEFNLHEFQIQEDGQKALILSSHRQRVEDFAAHQEGYVYSDCLHEFALESNSIEYTWCPLESGVTLNESCTEYPNLNETTEATAWDFLYECLHSLSDQDNSCRFLTLFQQPRKFNRQV